MSDNAWPTWAEVQAERRKYPGKWRIEVAYRRGDGETVTLVDEYGGPRPTIADLAYLLEHLDPTWTLVSVRTDWRA